MTRITIYDTDANELEKVAENNDMTVAELIECLMDYLPDVKEENNLK